MRVTNNQFVIHGRYCFLPICIFYICIHYGSKFSILIYSFYQILSLTPKRLKCPFWIVFFVRSIFRQYKRLGWNSALNMFYYYIYVLSIQICHKDNWHRRYFLHSFVFKSRYSPTVYSVWQDTFCFAGLKSANVSEAVANLAPMLGYLIMSCQVWLFFWQETTM